MWSLIIIIPLAIIAGGFAWYMIDDDYAWSDYKKWLKSKFVRFKK